MIHNSIAKNELTKLTSQQKITLALFCAEDVFFFNNDITTKPVNRCISLVKQWLANNDSVTSDELIESSLSVSDAAFTTETICPVAYAAALSASNAGYAAAYKSSKDVVYDSYIVSSINFAALASLESSIIKYKNKIEEMNKN
jgi:hypothetical protein